MDKLKETLMNDSLNRNFNEIKAKNPDKTEKQILELAVYKTVSEQRAIDAGLNIEQTGFMGVPNASMDKESTDNIVNTFGSLNPFGDGTTIKKSDDGVGIARVDHKWQQKKGSKISDDGFHKEGFATITLPKEIDVNTPEGDKKAGDFVEHLRAARKRGAKIEHEMKKKEWEDRKVQVTVNKEGV